MAQSPDVSRVLKGAGLVLAAGVGVAALALSRRRKDDPLLVNDMHSRLNSTRVAEIVEPTDFAELVAAVESRARRNAPICVCGSRHAMGGQQFAKDATLIDMRGLSSVIGLDEDRGIVHAEAGIEWPDLVDHLLRTQRERPDAWTIPTKQTGADMLTLGGALSANAHGRGLTRSPIAADVESFVLVDPEGQPVYCSRTQNPELFAHALGGYGLFGPIYSARLRLVRRQKLERVVEMIDACELMTAFDRRIQDGFTLGDWQFAIDEASDHFLHRGVLSCYRPVDLDTPIPQAQRSIPKKAWSELVYLAHKEKSRAFKLYADYYMTTTGQVYWSDTSQLGGYEEGYHEELDHRVGAAHPASEMITEIYVPRERFADYMDAAAQSIRANGASVIYGTVRLIEADTDTVLRWAKEPYACIIFNLHVEHTVAKIDAAARAFRDLIDHAIDRGGSFYLTYHRWATREQIEACYPMFEAFLRKKLAFDPNERYQSDWYRHNKRLFGI